MPLYRAFIVDAEGYILNAKYLDYPNDEAAVAEARQWVDGHDVEIWELHRRVALIRRDRRKRPAG